MQLPFLAASLVGLLGGVHCVGMCGGIVGALTLGLPAERRSRLAATLPFHLAYNVGRIASYGVAGALLGGVGLASARLLPVQSVQTLLQGVAGIFMIALGLYLGGWWFGLTRLEQGGAALWRRVEPVARRLLPVRSPAAALAVGAVWGWLPCGLVYSVLIMALTAGGPLEGALLMLSFGAGTLPTLIASGLLATRLAAFVRLPWVKTTAGVLVFLFGAWTLAGALGLHPLRAVAPGSG
ncbi:MAG: sulfite exporter TauE/SafE family protein [Gammaproteobacteria bacterium]